MVPVPASRNPTCNSGLIGAGGGHERVSVPVSNLRLPGSSCIRSVCPGIPKRRARACPFRPQREHRPVGTRFYRNPDAAFIEWHLGLRFPRMAIPNSACSWRSVLLPWLGRCFRALFAAGFDGKWTLFIMVVLNGASGAEAPQSLAAWQERFDSMSVPMQWKPGGRSLCASVLVLAYAVGAAVAQGPTPPGESTVTTQPVTTRPAAPAKPRVPPPPPAADKPKMPDLDLIEFVTTGSGLKIHDLIVGKGEEATHDAFVEFRFQGWLADGTYWQGSPDTGPPVMAPVSMTRFRGWSEGVCGMKEGGRRLMVCPPDLAFGERGTRGIPPNSTIVMDVELVRVVLKMTPTRPEDEVETPSGLKYVDIKVGDGDSPEPDGQVTVHHTGWLEDGTFFRSSVPRGTPETFPLGRAMPGWAEGVRSMKVGGKRKLIIPPELGYGDRPHPDVPPNSTLIYEVELLGVGPAPTTQPGRSPGPRPRGVRPGAQKPRERLWEGMPELP